MLNNLSAAFLAELSKSVTEPIQLLVFHFDQPIGDIFISDRDFVLDGQFYRGIVEDWGELSTVGSENAVSSTMVMSIVLWNGGNDRFSLNFLVESPVNVFVDVYQTFPGLSFVDSAHIGEFVLQDPIEIKEASQLLELELVTTNMRYFAQVGEFLTKENFPNALESDVNKTIDLIIGNAGTVKCLCSYKPSVGVLSGSFLEKPTTINIHENIIEKGFATLGINYLQIDEEIMSYSSVGETSFILNGRGLFGTKSIDHSDGSEVVQARTKNEYIIGQGELSSVSNVKIKGQVPTIPYELLLNQNPALIRFNSQPTYVEYSKGARTIEEYFDSTNEAENTALHPSWAYDPENKSLGAILGKDSRKLAIFQDESLIDEGQIIKVFLCVEHWATKAIVSDYAAIFVDGLNNDQSIGFLNRPNANDIIEVGGEVDIYHGHGHATGTSHTHSNIDPNFRTRDTPHDHEINITQESNLYFLPSSASYGFGSTSARTNSYYEYFDVSSYDIPKKIQSVVYSLQIAASRNYSQDYSGWITEIRVEEQYYSNGWKVGNVYQSTENINVGETKTVRVYNNAGWDYSSYSRAADRRLKVTLWLSVPGYGDVQYSISDPLMKSIEIIPSTGSKDLSLTTSKTANGSVTGLEQSTNVIKDYLDVDDISESQSQKDLEINLSENSSRSVTQRFDVTKYLESIDWDWLNNNGNGRYVHVDYTGSIDNAEIIITSICFEVEYRQRQVKTTDEVSCDPIGIIENRPDAVIQYLLTEKAGLPIEKLDSVYRSIPVWNDVAHWNDSIAWQDEGQVSDVPDGALFEEAASWFDLHGYEIDGVLPGNSSIKDAVSKVAFQSRSKLLWQNGKTKLIVLRKNEDWLSVRSIEPESIQFNSFEAKKSYVKDIINKIDLFYKIDRLSDSSGSGQYSLTASNQDQNSIVKNGEHQDEEKWLFDLVRRPHMASQISDFYLWQLGETTTYYSFKTYIENYDIEKEDYINISSSGFEFLNKVSVVIKEMVRSFGSGKLGKIDTLNIIAQSIRRIVYLEALNSEINMNDVLSIDFGLTPDIHDEALIFENLLIEQGTNENDLVLMSDIFTVLMNFSKTINDQLSITEEQYFEMNISLNDCFQLNDSLNVSDDPAFGSCGFGSPNGELPFGAIQTFREVSVDYANTIDILEILLNKGISDEMSINDELKFYDCFGCKLGDGFGITPFGF